MGCIGFIFGEIPKIAKIIKKNWGNRNNPAISEIRPMGCIGFIFGEIWKNWPKFAKIAKILQN